MKHPRKNKEKTEMAKAKAKVQTLQEKRDAAMKANLEIMKQRMAEIAEQKRLFEEKLAARTPEEIAEEAARWEANHQIEIETWQKRHSIETEEEAAYRKQVRANLAKVARI